MNNNRRKKMEIIISSLESLRDEIDEVMTEEREAFENLPESLQSSERGELMEQNADDLETAIDDLENVIYALNDIVENS